MNPLLDHLARQLRRPSGLLGKHLISRMLDRVNSARHDLTLEQLAPAPDDRVLEVGFGGGGLLDRVQQRVTRGFAAGVELSTAMLDHARRRFGERIVTDRFELAQGRVEALPYPSASFDKVYTVNTIYFWSDPALAFAELRRVLRPGGLLLCTFAPRSVMRRHWVAGRGYNLHEPEEIVALMERAGFVDLRLVRGEEDAGPLDRILGRRSPFYCATARRPPR
jgi:SAM-dependent methyltransferase